MINYAKQQSGIFCPGQTFTIGSESHGLLSSDSDHLLLTGTSSLIPKIIELKYLATSMNTLENEIQVEE